MNAEQTIVSLMERLALLRGVVSVEEAKANSKINAIQVELEGKVGRDKKESAEVEAKILAMLEQYKKELFPEGTKRSIDTAFGVAGIRSNGGAVVIEEEEVLIALGLKGKKDYVVSKPTISKTALKKEILAGRIPSNLARIMETDIPFVKLN